MTESNQQESSVSDWSLRERWRELDAPRRRWSRRCWSIGLTAIFGGLAGFIVSHTLYTERYLSTLVQTIDIASIILIIGGGLLVTFGPISWFWFRKSD